MLEVITKKSRKDRIEDLELKTLLCLDMISLVEKLPFILTYVLTRTSRCETALFYKVVRKGLDIQIKTRGMLPTLSYLLRTRRVRRIN